MKENNCGNATLGKLALQA